MQTRQHNVIVFFTDTQRHDCSGLHGNPLGLMPTFDRLARRGTHLVNATSPQPLCTPCRACLQTGLAATATGVYRNARALPQDQRTIAHLFNDAGYETSYIGKWHLNDETSTDGSGAVPRHRRGGWQRWLGANCVELTSEAMAARLWDEDDLEVRLPGYRTDATIDAAIRYLAEPKDRPFVLFLSLLEPHFQNTQGAYVAPPGSRDAFLGAWTPPDVAGLPQLVDERHPYNGEVAHHALADYWAMVRRIDDGLARLMEALASLDLAEDTIVAFTSDHGTHFNTRNLQGKSSIHEASTRVPAALWGGPFDGGGQRSEAISLLDLPPTLLDACGIAVPDDFHGRSILPLLRGDRAGWPADSFIQVSQSGVSRAIRTQRWKYGIHAPDASGWDDMHADRYVEAWLYDLEHDPYELRNLVTCAAHAEVRANCRERLLAHMARVGEPPCTIDPAPDPGPTYNQRVVSSDAARR